MPPVFNTPGYSIWDTWVIANGITRDICRIEEPLTIGFQNLFGVTIGELRLLHGSFDFHFNLYSDRGGPFIYSWGGSLQQLWGTDQDVGVWVSYTWARAGDATNNLGGLINFRPSLELPINKLGLDQSWSEFAVCPDDHYFMIVD